ncbi:NAD(P)-dependent oxidoreductase [Ferrovum sp.]|uniref:NAD(P)-dependent oxidoreductase n=1 Tax=Ferrovum sp. TaxID=2609467 RepID=UPI002633DF26|nr:NAD(P)-dependent oxidoreductase [Ferrovum sp.]
MNTPSSSSSQQVAVLGMGAMGSRMARSLIASGYSVTVWNIEAAACLPLVELGARHAMTPAEAVTHAEFVITMVWDDAASADVWLNPQTGALPHMKAGSIALECATLTLGHEKKLADACAAKGIEFVSAPMSGSLPEADNRTLVFTVGASEDAMVRIQPLLLAMGSKINHAGGPLDGISEKLMINGKLGIEYLAAAEMVALMKVGHMDVERRLAIKATTAPFSPRGLREARFMVDGDYTVRVKVNQMIKDLSYEIDQFERHGVPCPLHRAARSAFEWAHDKGHGEEDSTILAKLYEEEARRHGGVK